MAATDTSDGKTKQDFENDIRDIRAGKSSGQKSRLKVLVIALAAVVLAGGGAGAWFVLATPSDPVAAAEDAPPVVEAPRELTYIDLQPIFIQVETDRGELQNVVVTLALELELDSVTFKKVEAAMPRLYEAYLRTLTSRPIPGASDGRVDVTHIKNRIRAENLRLLGAGAVYDVVLRRIWLAEG